MSSSMRGERKRESDKDFPQGEDHFKVIGGFLVSVPHCVAVVYQSWFKNRFHACLMHTISSGVRFLLFLEI